jgi:hypothetical protein
MRRTGHITGPGGRFGRRTILPAAAHGPPRNLRCSRRPANLKSGRRPRDWSSVVLANPDLIDKLRVAVYPSIPFQAPTVGSPGCVFRFLPEPRGASARDPRSPPSIQRSAALGQATTETDSGGSVTLGLAMRGLERLAVQRLHRQSRDRHRLAPERLSLVLGLEGPTR